MIGTLHLGPEALQRAAPRLPPRSPPVKSQQGGKPASQDEARRVRAAAIRALHRRIAAACAEAIAPPRHGPTRLLKLHIEPDLFDRFPDASRNLMWVFLHWYTRNLGYITLQLVAGTPRVDLDGHQVDVVTERQAKWAALRLAGRGAQQEPFQTGQAAPGAR